MTTILEILSQGLDSEVRTKLRDCFETTLRHYRFLSDAGNENLRRLRQRGVDDDYLFTVFALAAFFQTVVGPVSASGRETDLDLVTLIPIRHGTERFDSDSARRTRSMLTGFRALLSDLGIQAGWLEVLHADDIVFRMRMNLAPMDADG